jgi:hypothetical protein
MQCHNCGSQLSEGLAFCQQCGTPVTTPSPSSIPPTVVASQPPYGNPNAHTNYNPSSMPGNSPAYATPQDPYSNNPYAPPQQLNNPYAPPQQLNNPYAQPQPNNVPPYPPTPQQQNNAPSYAPPPQPNYASYSGVGMPAVANPVPVKPKSKVGLIVGIVIVVLLIVIVGGAALMGAKSSRTTTTTATATANTGPSGNTIDSKAAVIVTDIQMASAIDTDTYKPKTLATSFKTYTDIYTTFQFNIGDTDVSQQNPGYVEAKYYKQNRLILTDDPLKIDDSIAPNGYGYGYFTVQYYGATTAGKVELYWCRKSNCSDGKLAQTTTFTVTV